MWKKLILILLLLSQITYAEKSDHIIFDTFKDWKVRHVFDSKTLKYKYSDAKTKIITDKGEKINFQFNHNAISDKTQYILSGWLTKVTIIIDGKYFTNEQNFIHTFYADASVELLNAISKTKNPIQIIIEENRMGQMYEIKGTMSPRGSSAALRWIRAIN